MPVSEEHILQLLDAEEPDYRAAIAEVGADGFDALTSLVQNADASVAARAASLAATLAADPAIAAAAVPVLALAANHVDPGVRAAAAPGASPAGAPAVTVVTKCLADADAGGRIMAFRGRCPPPDPAG